VTLLAAEKRAPDFSLPDLHGAETSIEHLLSRGPILLVFFKVTCPTCQFTLPFIDRIEKSGRLTIVGISQDDVSATNEFRAAFDVNFPMLIDDPGRNYPVSAAFGLTVVPSLFLIEKDGVVTWAEQGFSRRRLEELGHMVHVNPFRADERIPEFRPG
jgi:peroxiredoxin